MNYTEISQIKDYITTLELDKSPNTIRSYTTAIQLLIDIMNIESFEDIANLQTKDFREFQQQLKERGNSSSTINARMRPIKAMMAWLEENEDLKNLANVQKVKYLKVPKREKEFLTEDEILQMMNACSNKRDRLILAVLLSTGIRRGELVSLKTENYIDNHITVIGKGDKERTLVLPNDVCQLMDEWIIYRNKKYGTDNPYLFLSKYGEKYTGDGINQKIKGIMCSAGFSEKRIAEIHTHSLRHTFVANLFEANGDIFTAQKALGHANLSTTQGYAHIRNSALDDRMLQMKSVLPREEINEQ